AVVAVVEALSLYEQLEVGEAVLMVVGGEQEVRAVGTLEEHGVLHVDLASTQLEHDSTGAQFENPIRSDYHQTIMPSQDQAPLKDVDLEQMLMNLKEGDHYVVNHGEGLIAVDFDGHVSLAEKEGAGIVERRSGTGHAQEVEIEETDAAAPAPIAAARGCDRGWRHYCEAAVEEAAASAFGVAEAVGEGAERCRGDQRRSGLGSCPTRRQRVPMRKRCPRRLLRRGDRGRMLEFSAEEIATVTQGRRRGGRGGTEGEQSLAAIAEGWSQEKHDRVDLARKIDGKEEAGNSAVGRGRGPRLLRMQGQMRAEASAG
ncbi:hypothetical protein BHM03_00003754, partial [Ensete ventricosum]